MPANSAAEKPEIKQIEPPKDPNKKAEAPQLGQLEQKLLSQLASNDSNTKSNDTIDPDHRLELIKNFPAKSGGDTVLTGDNLPHQPSPVQELPTKIDTGRDVASYDNRTDIKNAANDEPKKQRQHYNSKTGTLLLY